MPKQKTLRKHPEEIITPKGIYIATWDYKKKGKIWRLHDEKEELIATRSDVCYSLRNSDSFHNFLSDLTIPVKWHSPGTDYNLLKMIQPSCPSPSLFNTLSDSEGKNPIPMFAQPLGPKVIFLNDFIYTTVDKKILVKTSEDSNSKFTIIAKRKHNVIGLYIFKDELYDFSGFAMYNTIKDPKGRHPFVKNESVVCLCTHNGQLIGGNILGKIYNVLENKPFFKFEDSITAMLSVE